MIRKNENMNLYKLGAYINTSSYRKKALNYLSTHTLQTPTQISKGTDIRTNHISKTLKELKDKKLIECINEEQRKGRLYIITQFGKQVNTTATALQKGMEVIE